MTTSAKRSYVSDIPTSSKKSNKKCKSTDWDVDDYRTEYESEEHWQLRRDFMLAHKDRFDEERLVCLAQTFINMEFMGCKYPKDTMLLVAEMSKEIAGDFRKNRAMRLKRTFVSASDAAEQRAKGRRGTQSVPTNLTEDFKRLSFGGGEPIDLFSGLPYGNLIIYLAGGRGCLRNSCAAFKLKYDERESEVQPTDGTTKFADVLVNDIVIATASGDNIKSARLYAHKAALFLLQSVCYSIKLNAARETIKVEKNKQGININVTKESADKVDYPKLTENNKGYHMMRLMGWTGGGLGRQKQGREEPVGYLLKNNRMGLGSNDNPKNVGNHRHLIKNYVNSDDMRDLQFEPTFSKQERAIFHQVAAKYGLRSASYTAADGLRRLMISKKVTYADILREVLIQRNPKFCERYFVQVPMQKAHLFPGHVAALDLEYIME